MGVLVAAPLFKIGDEIPSFGTGSEDICNVRGQAARDKS